jgi:hypothetical protein
MTHVDEGVRGAKRATWREANPRKRLIKIISDNDRAEEKVWREEFWEEVKKDRSDKGELRACIEYWLDNNIHALTGHSDRKKKRSKAAREALAADVEEIKEEIRTNLMFLSLVCPNGKQLRHCTGADCRKFGGWYLTLSKRVPAQKEVGQVLDETEVGKIWASTH